MPGQNYDPQVFSNMQTGKPYKSYKKTVLGKVYVTLLDPFTSNPVGYLIEGQPNAESAIVDVWSEMEDVFFKRTNKRQFELGNILPYERPDTVKDEPLPFEQFSDEQLKEIINKPFLVLQNKVNKTQSTTVLTRLILLAKELDKSEKIISFLEGRLSELQVGEYTELEKE